MTKVILVRHGEVAGNAGEERAFVGWGNPPLNERGRAQARAVGERLKDEPIEAVYSSDLLRARDTAQEIASRHGLEVHADIDLREVNYGKWEGLSEAQLLEQYPQEWIARQNDPWNIATLEGENHAQMWARVLPKWNALLEKHPGKTVVLVAHNGLLRILICSLLGMPFGNFKRICTSNGGITRIEFRDGKVLLESLNETSHLNVGAETETRAKSTLQADLSKAWQEQERKLTKVAVD